MFRCDWTRNLTKIAQVTTMAVALLVGLAVVPLLRCGCPQMSFIKHEPSSQDESGGGRRGKGRSMEQDGAGLRAGGRGLAVTLPQFDGLVVLQRGRGD